MNGLYISWKELRMLNILCYLTFQKVAGTTLCSIGRRAKENSKSRHFWLYCLTIYCGKTALFIVN